METTLLYPIVLPLVLGVFCLFIPQRVKFVREILTFIGATGVFALCIWFFSRQPLEWSYGNTLIFKLDSLSSFVMLASGLFGFLITIFSFKFMKNFKQHSLYYGSLLMTMGMACGAFMANHLVVLLVFWGMLAVTLYLLVLTGGEKASASAKKTLIIVGGTDALMLLGIILIYAMKSTFLMDQITLSFNQPWVTVAFVILALGAFAKAGAMPLHTWIPDVAETAPMTVTAYLPAALDKLLGIYLLARICLSMFVMNAAMNLFLMIIGSVTIIAAVMMALIQHDLRKLLAYHAVSQVGYMVLGIGTGNPIGIAGGLFHMLNHSIYKACLFLTGASVQHRTGTTDLKKLGGLGRLMPMTFISFLIAAFAISGIPPFNGFASKWMVYQGLTNLAGNTGSLWFIWLIAAMFGSALTLASFMKLTHSVFLGTPPDAIQNAKIKEVSWSMSLPTGALAMLCVIFGIFAFTIPLKHFLLPAIPGIEYVGIWSPGLATILIIVGLVVGLIIYLMGKALTIREADTFTGGEPLSNEERITGTGFYNTIREVGGIQRLYVWAEKKWFDIYDRGMAMADSVAGLFRKAHTGVLTTYVFWLVTGMVVLVVIFMFG